MTVLYKYTSDGLRLPAFCWEPAQKSTCIIYTHGLLDLALENYFMDDLAKACVSNGYGFIFGHNRSYGTITDMGTNTINADGSIQTRTYGTAFDNFEENVNDIQLWIDTAKELGYENVILMGHSMGCCKVVYYLSKNKVDGLKGVILTSPPDIAGMEQVQPDYKTMLAEAKANIAVGKPDKLMSSKIWGFLYLSSGTFVNYFDNINVTDSIPTIAKPDKFKQLSKIQVPILAIFGSNDNVIIRSAEEDLALLKSKATGCPEFSYTIIQGANHRYMNKGVELSNEIINWAKKLS